MQVFYEKFVNDTKRSILKFLKNRNNHFSLSIIDNSYQKYFNKIY